MLLEIQVVQNLDKFSGTLKVLNVAENELRTLSDVPTTTMGIYCTSFGVNVLIKLVSLDISKNKILSLDGLSELKLLERLDISVNIISSVSEVNKLKQNPTLRFLSLAENPIANKA